jgi:predicted RNase H-like nuclease (RuvC/YqgF family)
MNFVESYKNGFRPKLSDDDVLKILEYANELKNRNEELEEKLEEKLEEMEELARDPKICDCGYRGRKVLINGGKCDSCM